MRVLAAALLLAACATTPPAPGAIAGCWAERAPRNGQTAVMQWSADVAQPNLLHGAYSPSRGAEPTQLFTLNENEPARLCQTNASGEERCWQVARAQTGSLEGGRAFVDLHRQRLRIAIIETSVERVVFSGVREECR